MILNDLFLEINQVFTRAYCARDGARPCRLRPLPCDWLLPKRRDIIRLLGNKDKWLSYVVILNREPQQRDLPMQGKCGFHFKIRILFNFFLSFFLSIHEFSLGLAQCLMTESSESHWRRATWPYAWTVVKYGRPWKEKWKLQMCPLIFWRSNLFHPFPR